MTREIPALEHPHTAVNRASRRFLEGAQDILVVALTLALFGLTGRTLVGLFYDLVAPLVDFREVIAEILFVLVLVELVRLLLVYLQEHRVAVDFMVELGIVSTLREVTLRGVVELNWPHLLAISVFLLALGLLLRLGDLRGVTDAEHGRSVEPDRSAVRPGDGIAQVIASGQR
jgi:uncharacterized membrane protein (DUF373 family)